MVQEGKKTSTRTALQPMTFRGDRARDQRLSLLFTSDQGQITYDEHSRSMGATRGTHSNAITLHPSAPIKYSLMAHVSRPNRSHPLLHPTYVVHLTLVLATTPCRLAPDE